jgi:glycosyltransferase involved in cell wall biosynthesis
VPGAALRDVRSIQLGAGLGHVLASQGLPDHAGDVLDHMRSMRSVLMVGTIEPRKCHAQVLDAFEQLWSAGVDAMLVICGRPGWMMETLIERLRTHPANGKRLLWIEDASDEYLDAIYGAATVMLLASRGEGFGLPLVEAAQRGLPVIARDLPVFREVAGEHAHYFSDDSAEGLAASLRTWLDLHARGEHPRSGGMRWLTWAQSAARLRRILARA